MYTKKGGGTSTLLLGTPPSGTDQTSQYIQWELTLMILNVYRKAFNHACDEYNVLNLFLLTHSHIPVFMILRFTEILHVYYMYMCTGVVKILYLFQSGTFPSIVSKVHRKTFWSVH